MPSYISGLYTLTKPTSWVLTPAPSSFAPNGWSNKDMEPVPVGERTWTTWNYVVRKRVDLQKFILKARSGLLDFGCHERSWCVRMLS